MVPSMLVSLNTWPHIHACTHTSKESSFQAMIIVSLTMKENALLVYSPHPLVPPMAETRLGQRTPESL